MSVRECNPPFEKREGWGTHVSGDTDIKNWMGHPADVGHPRTVVQENRAAQITGYSVVPLGLDWLKLLTPGLRPGLHVLSPVGGWICELRCRSGCNRQCRYIGLTSVRLLRPSWTRRVENADPGLTPGATHFRRCAAGQSANTAAAFCE